MKKILIAEDNDSNYLLMTYILKAHYEFFRACNGQEAVLKALAERPDLGRWMPVVWTSSPNRSMLPSV